MGKPIGKNETGGLEQAPGTINASPLQGTNAAD